MKIIINEKQQDRLIKEYLDKEYMKPLYDYLQNGSRYSNGGFYNATKRMVIPFFDWVTTQLDDNDFKKFAKALNNCNQLQGKIRTTYGYDGKHAINCFTQTQDGLKKVNTRTFLRQNESRIFTITYNDNELALFWDKFMSFINSLEGKKQLKKGKYLEADTVLMNPQIMKPQWLIHFTSEANALDICKNGFKYGLEPKQIKQLGYTNNDINDVLHGHIEKEAKHGKYMYAYNADEISDGFFPSDLITPRENWGFDNMFDQKVWENALHYAVMFTAPGLEVRHDTDNQQQVIFNTDMAHNFVLLTFKWDRNRTKTPDKRNTREYRENQIGRLIWGVSTIDGKHIYTNRSLTEVITWVMNNYSQYRKQICFRK